MKPWPERFPEVAEADEAHWLSNGFTKTVDAPDKVTYEGTVRSSVKGADGRPDPCDYLVRISYPPGYPYVPPTVTFIAPPITESRHMAHGEPCLFSPQDWGFGVEARDFEIQIVKWLRGHRTGVWDNELPVYELPAYYPSAQPSILLPENTLATVAGQLHGGFSIQYFAGVQIAVLRTINKHSVGDSLITDLALPRSSVGVGHWFRISREPAPLRNTAALAAVLRSNGHHWSDNKAPWKPQIIALVFDDAKTGETRFFTLRYQAKAKGESRPVVTGWPLAALSAHTVSRAEMFKRVQDVRDLDALDDTRVAIFGLGAIGSAVADLLVREGVGAFKLLDPDGLKPGNLVRHTLDLRSVGESKAEAVSQSLYRINPDCEVDAEISKAGLADPSKIEMHLADADLVVSAIGDDVTEEMLSEVVVAGQHDIPMIVVRNVHAGHAIRIMRIRRGIDACMSCLDLHRGDGHPDWIHIPDSDYPDIFDESCAAPSSPGAGLAVRDAANRATRHVLETLGSLQPADPAINHWVTILEPITKGTDVRLTQLQTHTATFPPHLDCPRCG